MKWEDPPTKRRNGGRKVLFQAEATKLREHPKRWAVIRTLKDSDTATASQRATNLASSLKRGTYKGFAEPHLYEFTSRDGKVYARYIGE